MKGFKRAVGLGLLVGGALGGWGCGKETPPADTQGFQDPVQLQHRAREDAAGRPAGSNLGASAQPGSGGRPYDSDSPSAMGGGTTGLGRQTGGSAELGTGLAESYRGGTASEGTGGSGRDAGTGTMDAGTMDAGTRDAGTMDAGTRH